jgi:4-diphosphocytidyl-2-C-methyl-D-erythritol kinase
LIATVPKAETVVEPARAKLNLYLHVTGRRADGFHLLDSLAAFAELGDEIRASSSSALSLTVEGPFAGALGDPESNLVLRAARLLQAGGAQQGAHLTLTKVLPVASGIGGGSADAAATLRALRKLWGVPTSDALLQDQAGALGSDVPVCVFGRTAFMAGVGDAITPAPPLPPAALVLVNPGIALATPDVFRARAGPFSPSAAFDERPRDTAGLAAVLSTRRNDLEAPAIGLVPEIAEVLRALSASPGCRLARMSGSGATCFGLYDDDATAAAAVSWLAARKAPWWTKATRLAVG